jgi:trehalose/maltose hydrolase-like predicted phosphorylase
MFSPTARGFASGQAIRAAHLQDAAYHLAILAMDRDTEFFALYGAELILDTAVFWGSRVESRNGRYEISQQIGPDEYHENIDNSVFVNRMVVWHLQTALETVEWLRQNAPTDADRLIHSLNLTPERLVKWQDIIEKMYIPFDSQRQIHIQFPSFFDPEYIRCRTCTAHDHVQAIPGHARTIQHRSSNNGCGDDDGAVARVLMLEWCRCDR